MNYPGEKPIEILLVEDNEGDILLTKKAFESAKIANNFHIAYDGEMALAMLRKQGEYSNIPKPDLVLLDINLPKKDGKTTLKEIREDENLTGLPVVMLSSSSAERDIQESYDLHANSYIVKPIDFSKFHEIVTAIESFWFKVVSLPDR